MTNRRGQYIAVCGPIGVGKSVFANVIAEFMGASLVPEVFKENPYLEDFYEPGGKERWGFHTEMAFLSRRFDQMKEIGQRLDEGEDIVTDWTFPQVLVYSSTTLSEREFGTYKEIYDRLIPSVPEPDLLVCLDAKLDTLEQRIIKRGRAMEKKMDVQYLAELQAGYHQWKQSPPYPTTWIDTTNLPIPTSEDARTKALGFVWEALESCPIPQMRRPGSGVRRTLRG